MFVYKSSETINCRSQRADLSDLYSFLNKFPAQRERWKSFRGGGDGPEMMLNARSGLNTPILYRFNMALQAAWKIRPTSHNEMPLETTVWQQVLNISRLRQMANLYVIIHAVIYLGLKSQSRPVSLYWLVSWHYCRHSAVGTSKVTETTWCAAAFVSIHTFVRMTKAAHKYCWGLYRKKKIKLMIHLIN